MNDATDTRLLSRLAQGDHAALGDLLERHRQRLYNIALRMVHHRDDAAELTQEAMLKIIAHIHDYHAQSSISTWMIRIVMNLSISHLRKRRLRYTQSIDGNGHDPQHADVDDQLSSLRKELMDHREPDPALSVQQSEMLHHLQQAMARLEVDFRAVLVLRDIDQMDYPDIAAALSIPVGTVKSRLFRARLALRQAMTSKEPMPEDTGPQTLEPAILRDLRRPLPKPQPRQHD